MGSESTVLFFGFETPPALKRAYSGMIYEGWLLADDPFDLGRGECGGRSVRSNDFVKPIAVDGMRDTTRVR